MKKLLFFFDYLIKPEMLKVREEAGAIIETQKMIKLVE